MKNVTISMDDDLLAWVRVEAAKSGQSVSRWLAGRLADARAGRPAYDADVEETLRLIDEFLAEPGWPISDEDGKAFDRAEIYDSDERFRRFDDPDLSRGQERADEARQGVGVGESARPFRGASPKSAGSE